MLLEKGRRKTIWWGKKCSSTGMAWRCDENTEQRVKRKMKQKTKSGKVNW